MSEIYQKLIYPELFTSHNHEIQNNLIINLLPYNNMSQSSKIYRSLLMKHTNGMFKKLSITLGFGLFIMALALFNVSFP
jgi:hypothetical protein